jgi:hypothetical protein
MVVDTYVGMAGEYESVQTTRRRFLEAFGENREAEPPKESIPIDGG